MYWPYCGAACLHSLAQAHLVGDARPAAVLQRELHALLLEPARQLPLYWSCLYTCFTGAPSATGSLLSSDTNAVPCGTHDMLTFVLGCKTG